MMLLRRIWAFATGQDLVALRDADGEVTVSFAYVNAWGEREAKRHWPFKIHQVRLDTGGTVSRSAYVKEWKFL